MNRITAILTLLFLLPLAGWSHGDKSPISISGVILGQGSSTGVSGAIISIEKNGEVIQTTETDCNGNFSLKMEGYISRMDHVKFVVQKKGYKSQRFRPVDGREQNLRIELQRQSPIPIIKPVGGAPVLAI